jgi:hypothetical protein
MAQGSARSATISAWNGGATSTARGCCAAAGIAKTPASVAAAMVCKRESLVWRMVSYLSGLREWMLALHS